MFSNREYTKKLVLIPLPLWLNRTCYREDLEGATKIEYLDFIKNENTYR